MNGSPYGERSFAAGRRAAFYFGAEYQANAQTLDTLREAKDSAAFYFRPNAETRHDLTAKETAAMMEEFNRGRAAEKRHQL